MHLAYSSTSGLLAVVATANSSLMLYNVTTLAVVWGGAGLNTSSSPIAPSQGVITVGTQHCASTANSLICIDWTTGETTSIPLSSNPIAGQPIAVNDRYVIARDSYDTVTVVDMTAYPPSMAALSAMPGTGYIVAQPAGAIAPDGTLVVAVPMSGGTTRVFFGLTASVDVTCTTDITFTTNALAFGGYLWVAGNVTDPAAGQTAQLTRIPVVSANVALNLTNAKAAQWVMQGSNTVGNMKNLFASPLIPGRLFTFGDTFTGWDATTGRTYFSVPPLPTLFYWTASNSNGNYDYFPTVDAATLGVVVGMGNVSNGVFMGWAVLSPFSGALLRFVPVPANAATGQSFQPQSTASYHKNLLVLASTHMCEYSTLSNWSSATSPSVAVDYFNARVCTTLDGQSSSFGWAAVGDWYYALIGGALVKAAHVPQWYQSSPPFDIASPLPSSAPSVPSTPSPLTSSPSPSVTQGGDARNAAPDDNSKTPIAVGAVIAVLGLAVGGVVAGLSQWRLRRGVGGAGARAEDHSVQDASYTEMPTGEV